MFRSRCSPARRLLLSGIRGREDTIISLLSRFYEIQKGEILIDDINIKDVNVGDLRSHIAVVLQDVFLFSGDIKGNISLGNDAIPFERVKAAAEFVGVDQFIQTMPRQYDEAVKERGSTLSVGQKQLLSFARALAYNPKILVLDEATSSVDTQTELLIQSAIKKLLAGRSSIVIAHPPLHDSKRRQDYCDAQRRNPGVRHTSAASCTRRAFTTNCINCSTRSRKLGSDYADGADSAQIADYADSLLYTRFREFNLDTPERYIS